MMAAGGTQLDKILEADTIDAWQFHVDWKNPSKTKLDGPGEDRGRAVSLPVRRAADQLRAAARHRPRPRRAGRQDHVAPRLSPDRQPRVDRRRALRQHRGGRRRRALVRVPDRQGAQGHAAPAGHLRARRFFRWMASPAIDRFGNIGIGYSFGGTPHFAGQRFAGARARGSARHARPARNDPRRRRGVADQHAAVGGLHDDRDGSVRRLHRLVRRRLPEEGRRELLDEDRRLPHAGVRRR